MQLGLMLTTSDGVIPSEQFRLHVRMAQEAERAGFTCVVAPQHYLFPAHVYLQPIPLLAALATETSIRLATGVLLLSILNPVQVAEEIATLDAISGGRAILGVGVGHRAEEFGSFGIPAKERTTRLEENLRLVRRLWESVEPVVAEGPYHWLGGWQITFRPMQQPSPPIWVAGVADAGVRRAAALGDAWYVNPSVSLGALARQLAIYRSALDAAGRPFPAALPIRRDVYVAASSAAAREVAGDLVRQRYLNYRSNHFADDFPNDERRALESTSYFSSDPQQAIGDRFIAGTPDQCVDQLNRLQSVVDSDVVVVCRVQWPGRPESESIAAIRSLGVAARAPKA
jgi:alkanesulfonate monooxygenase SsuD/methylene tetrahydromethanopterin reductase-like flavin-dependent oxidoreductase (luciferase family)